MSRSWTVAALLILACVIAGAMAHTTPQFSGDTLTYLLIREHALEVYRGACDGSWNPLLQMGYPFHAESEGALFYPVQLALYAMLPVADAFVATFFVHMAAMAFFSYLYFRRIGISDAGSLVAALHRMRYHAALRPRMVVPTGVGSLIS